MGKGTKDHDRFFKLAVSNLHLARSLIGQHLPKKFLNQIDLDSLTPTKSNFINSVSKELSTDALFRASINNAKGYVLLHIEHQSTVRRESCINNCLTMMRPAMLLAVIYQHMRGWQRPGVKLLA